MASKEDIINYVMNSPANSNRAVLEGMLEDVSEGGGTSMIVRMDAEGMTDKTWQEVYDALANGILVCVLSTISADSGVAIDIVAHAPILMAAGGNGNYKAVMMSISIDETSARIVTLVADSADGYLHVMTDAG